jgi:hypothetical protein
VDMTTTHRSVLTYKTDDPINYQTIAVRMFVLTNRLTGLRNIFSVLSFSSPRMLMPALARPSKGTTLSNFPTIKTVFSHPILLATSSEIYPSSFLCYNHVSMN